MRLLLAAFALAPATLIAQTAASDDAAVREVVRKYADARELRDPKAVGALFAPDADQLVSTGEWRKGRDVLVRGMLASSEQNSGKRTITVETVRFPAPSVALADARYEIAASAGREARKMWSTFIMTKTGGTWRIEAIRNMLPAGSR
jgi:uncharacterized protein (TIGR02246 family)